MNAVTITLPAIDETVVANLETLTTETLASETEALRAIRVWLGQSVLEVM
jgi:hypothetical protein